VPPYKILLSYEEAIGFAHGMAVVDKDGVSAAVVMAELVNHLTAQGKTLVDCLHGVYERYGYHATKGSYFICRSQPTIDKIFGAIRKDGNYPKKVGEVDIVHVRDLTTGFDSSKPGNKATLPTQSSNMITFYLSNDSVVTLRTSGKWSTRLALAHVDANRFRGRRTSIHSHSH
jgi:phosphomannomutase